MASLEFYPFDYSYSPFSIDYSVPAPADETKSSSTQGKQEEKLLNPDSSASEVAQKVDAASDTVLKKRKKRQPYDPVRQAQIRQESSRVSSKAYRTRKKQMFEDLKTENSELQQKNQELAETISRLQQQIAELNSQIKKARYQDTQNDNFELKPKIAGLKEWEDITQFICPLSPFPEFQMPSTPSRPDSELA